jgi:NAD(P)-dependent dehydrogenase (short-subunit alcohol dehydrogenase family)
MTFLLRGKTALVTGASSGLGRHFSRVLAGAGAAVALAARRLERLRELQEDIEAAGGRAMAVAMDVTDAGSVTRGFAAAEAALGPIGILVNNAGIPSGAFFLDMSEVEWRNVMSVNLDGVFRVGQEGARRMVAGGAGGSIIITASMLSFAVSKSLSAYSASKAAVASLTRSMALELARENIRVNALAPGYVDTELNDAFLASPAGQRLLGRVPLRRAANLAELDGPLLLLASDASSYMTGSIVVVDGGQLLTTG